MSPAITPAQLGFFAIFNPSLGATDETMDDQIVYYASIPTLAQRRRHRARGAARNPTAHVSQAERNERLRQIGLAQGMVEFARGFSGGASVETVETERSRVVLREVEEGWWVLASIDLTKIPLPPKLPTSSAPQPEQNVEYTSKDLKPPALLLQDLLRAHSIFLLHHDSSLSSLFARSRRTRFVALLTRYWDLFLSTWRVMLHGNPARGVFGAINVAVSGELGVGVGEEERGSGEREVLEGLVGRVDGLVDVIVSKFGEGDGEGGKGKENEDKDEVWLGTGQDPGHEDGVVFAGTGALSRRSLRDVTSWMEDLYTWGENAYGVIESPTSTRQRQAGRKRPPKVEDEPPPKRDSPDLKKNDLKGKTSEIDPLKQGKAPQEQEPASSGETTSQEDTDSKMDKFVNVLKLGYGTYWSLGSTPSDSATALSDSSQSKRRDSSASPKKLKKTKPASSPADDTAGHYLIGLKGIVEEQPPSDVSSEDSSPEAPDTRTVLRTVRVELTQPSTGASTADVPSTQGQEEAQPPGKTKLRIVVYVNKPFIFAFLFNLHTDSLELSGLYRSLHYQLAPLRKPLLQSTSYRPPKPDGAAGIFDLVWDRESMSLHCGIPNIPDTPTLSSWSRTEALSVHSHLLNIYASTRLLAELERTAKTNRGWWVIWTRILTRPFTKENLESSLSTIREMSSRDEEESHNETGTEIENETDSDGTGDIESIAAPPEVSKEIFLVRKASDHAGSRGFSSSFAEGGWSSGSGEGARLAQGMGIGVDARKYIEGLLSLDR